MTNYVYIATSLDGFIASSDNGLEWLNNIPNPEKSDYGFTEFIADIDAIVMGRNTFETVLTFDVWPYEVPVFVLTNSLSVIPTGLAGKADIVNGDLRKLVRQLNELGYKNLYIDGGKTIQSFLEDDLIDEIIITRVPILLGNGIPLFGALTKEKQLSHKQTNIYSNGLVQSHYTRFSG